MMGSQVSGHLQTEHSAVQAELGMPWSRGTWLHMLPRAILAPPMRERCYPPR
jgi:hypothetical protein